MAITSDNPTIIPEVVIPGKVFDKWWIQDIHIHAPDSTIGAACTLVAQFRKFRRDDVTGIGEFSDDLPVTMTINNIFDLPAGVNDLAGGMIDQVSDFLGQLAKGEGLIT